MFKLDLHRLAVFHAVVSEGSLSNAAKRLFMSQPAISAHIKALEQQLGFPVFYREGRRSVVNKAGEVLYKKAEDLFNVADELRAEMDNLRGIEIGRLTLGVSLNWQYRLPMVLDRFRKKYPRTELSMEVANSDRIEQLVLDRTLDIGFVSKTSTRGELESRHVADDRLVPICSSSHRFAAMDEVAIVELSNEPMIMREPHSVARDLTKALFDSIDIEANVSMELGSYEAIKATVIAGGCIGMVPMQSLDAELHTGLLALPNIPRLTAPIPLNLIYQINRKMPDVVEEFIQLTTAEVYDLTQLKPLAPTPRVNGSHRVVARPTI